MPRRPYFIIPRSHQIEDRTPLDLARAAAPMPVPASTFMDMVPYCHPTAALDVRYADGAILLLCHTCKLPLSAYRLAEVLPPEGEVVRIQHGQQEHHHAP